jgi:hypothetical protein
MSIPDFTIKTSIPDTGPPLPNDNIKSAGPPKPTGAPSPHDTPSQTTPASTALPVAPRAPQSMGGGGGPDVSHLPNQVRPGLRAPIPVSRTPWERPADLDALLFNVGRLKRNSRSWYNDGEWPELKGELEEWLWILFDEYKQHGMQPALWYDIGLVRFELHLHPLPRDLMVWDGPEKTT